MVADRRNLTRRLLTLPLGVLLTRRLLTLLLVLLLLQCRSVLRVEPEQYNATDDIQRDADTGFPELRRATREGDQCFSPQRG
jgi:hypothetical protein